MGGKYKASIFNFIFNSLNSIVLIINGIILVPIYFKYISLSTYGAWLATGNIVGMLGLLESGFASVITQKISVALAQKDEHRFQVLSGSNILSAMGISFAILVLGLIAAPFITGWINAEDSISDDLTLAFILSLLATCISIFVSLLGAFPQVWQDTKQIGINNTIANVTAIATLVISLISGCGVASIALSYIVRALFNLTLNCIWIINYWEKKNYPKPVYSLSDTLLLTKDCIYPLLSKISSTVVGNSQSFIIAHFMNPGLAAIYDITSKICMVACGFVSQMNGSFFALFSLTLAEKNKKETNNMIYNTSMLFITMLATTILYSICFSEPIINYWVGLDKFGGTTLLIIIVLASIFAQIRSYFNSILYTGGMISKSAKYDIGWMIVYLFLLLASISNLQIYAIPFAMLTSCFIFIWVYMALMKKFLGINVKSIINLTIRVFALIIPFAIAHFYLAPDYHNLLKYGIYFITFSCLYIGLLYITNIRFYNQILKIFSIKN